MDYCILLEKLMSSLTCSKEFDIERIYDVLKQLGMQFRISKGVTIFYDNPEQERLKKENYLSAMITEAAVKSLI